MSTRKRRKNGNCGARGNCRGDFGGEGAKFHFANDEGVRSRDGAEGSEKLTEVEDTPRRERQSSRLLEERENNGLSKNSHVARFFFRLQRNQYSE